MEPRAARNVLAILDSQLREETRLAGYRFRLEVATAMTKPDPALMSPLAAARRAYEAAWDIRNNAQERLQKMASNIRRAERAGETSLVRTTSLDRAIASIRARLVAQFSSDSLARLQDQLEALRSAAVTILDELERAHTQARQANQQLITLAELLEVNGLPEQLRIAALRAQFNARLVALEAQLAEQQNTSRRELASRKQEVEQRIKALRIRLSERFDVEQNRV
ncbi:MAG: hypothetical protein GKR94_08805 [Gammaproteobacteria bacterium]|nr:hypothetical protein [Gammaproteobacteria bacterium]